MSPNPLSAAKLSLAYLVENYMMRGYFFEEARFFASFLSGEKKWMKSTR